MTTSLKILSDIGGTYARFSVVQDDSPAEIRKYKAADFPDLQSALMRYCDDINAEKGGELLIATAGYDDNGIWKFVNQNKWEIDPKALEAKGWRVTKTLNDFEAATWALVNVSDKGKVTLKEGGGESESLCLLGPGTGLGLGYLHQASGKAYVQKTHGGHMPIACITEEQFEAMKAFQGDAPVVFEHLVSGPGLQKLRTLYEENKALRLFHEFLGVFAANAVITGHAYGGLYLTGGVITSLMEDGLFDFKTFEKYMCANGAPSVSAALNNTPVYALTNPYPALKGLLNA